MNKRRSNQDEHIDCLLFIRRNTNTAQEIAKHLGADLLEIRPKKNYSNMRSHEIFFRWKDVMTGKKPELEPYDFSKNQYDAIVVGTPVWAASMAPPVRTFLEAYDFSDKKVGFFVVAGVCETQKCFLMQ